MIHSINFLPFRFLRVPVDLNHVLVEHPRAPECHVFAIGGPQQAQPPVLPLGEVVPPGQQGPPVPVQRIILAATLIQSKASHWRIQPETR